MEAKKRGRPSLTEEERKARRTESYRRQNEKRKQSGWATEKAYRAKHPELQAQKYAVQKNKYHTITVRIPREFKPTFDALLASTGKTITELMLDALEKQYGVNLHADSTEHTHDIPTHQDDE